VVVDTVQVVVGALVAALVVAVDMSQVVVGQNMLGEL